MKKLLKTKKLLITLCLIISSGLVNSNVLDDLIIKKKPLINQIIIELLEAGMTDEWENLDSSTSSKIGTDICKAGGGSNCSYVSNIGYGICKAGGGSNCSYINSGWNKENTIQRQNILVG